MPVPHAALGDDVIGKMLHVAHVTFQHGDFQTVVVVVDVDMQRGDGEVVVMMLGGDNTGWLSRVFRVHTHTTAPRNLVCRAAGWPPAPGRYVRPDRG